MMILELKNITKRFGGIVALNNVKLQIEKGKVLGLIGPNGAGKSTLFDVITGFLLPESGDILFNGKSIKGLKPFTICQKGIARTFQKCKPFLNETVVESVMTGAFCRINNIKDAKEEALKIIEFIGLAPKKKFLISDITFAEQRFVELAQDLATKPDLLFLDEVLAGLTPEEVKKMCAKIKEINNRGITIVLVEHVMAAVMELSDQISVLNYGQIIAEGTPKEIAVNKEVIKAYLGVEYHA